MYMLSFFVFSLAIDSLRLVCVLLNWIKVVGKRFNKSKSNIVVVIVPIHSTRLYKVEVLLVCNIILYVMFSGDNLIKYCLNIFVRVYVLSILFDK